MKQVVRSIIEKYDKDETRLMDILMDTQEARGYISPEDIDIISRDLNLSQVDIEQTISFYHFFSLQPLGKYNIYLNNSAVANMMGCREVARIFEEETGCKFGEVTDDGLIGLFYTSCIGMNDQEPAAIINGLATSILVICSNINVLLVMPTDEEDAPWAFFSSCIRSRRETSACMP